VIEDALLLQVEPVIRTAPPPTRAIVNAGLWLDDPDVDAITRLCNDIVTTECHSRPAFFFCNLHCLLVLMGRQRYTRDSSYVMANGTWCPFNSQNTALHRDLIPAYVLSPLIGRMDDIWARFNPRISSCAVYGCVTLVAVTLLCASWTTLDTAAFSGIRW